MYAGTIRVTEKDLWRWAWEERDDILQWVSTVDLGDRVEYDFPIHPVTDEEVTGCPFLRKLPNKNIYVCRIHDTKPEACAKFPMSRQQAEDVGCPGLVAED